MTDRDDSRPDDARRVDSIPADYDVGFCKPPKATQFKKGQSGNPAGRPKGAKNTATVANAVLNEKITITENGRQKVVTKREALMKQLVNRSVQGDLGFLRLVVTQVLPAVDAAQGQGSTAAAVPIDDAALLAPLLEQLRTSSPLVLPPAASADVPPIDSDNVQEPPSTAAGEGA